MWTLKMKSMIGCAMPMAIKNSHNKCINEMKSPKTNPVLNNLRCMGMRVKGLKFFRNIFCGRTKYGSVPSSSSRSRKSVILYKAL